MRLIFNIFILLAVFKGNGFIYSAEGAAINEEFAEKIKIQRPIKAILPVNENQNAYIIPKSHLLQLELIKNLYPEAKFALSVKRTFLNNSTNSKGSASPYQDENLSPALTADTGTNDDTSNAMRSSTSQDYNDINTDQSQVNRYNSNLNKNRQDYTDYYEDDFNGQNNYYKQQESNTCCREVQILRSLLEREIQRNKNLKKKFNKKFARKQFYNVY